MPDPAEAELAKTLVQAGHLTAEQMEACRAGADPAAGVTTIDVALRRGLVQEGQVQAAKSKLDTDKARERALRRDAAVAKLALQRQFVTRERIEAARKDQLERRQKGQDLTLLQTLVDRACLSEEQAENLAAAVGEEGRRRLGDFEILRKLGQGGMGSVYRARQVSLDRIVALKILPDRLAADETFVKRFYREAQACAKLDHPNIVRGLAVGAAEGHHFFAMEFVDGQSLRAILEREGPLPVWRAVPLFVQVAKGLAHAHSRDLIHRDIKPDNILVTRDGVPKLADLGLAKEVTIDRSAITESGMAMGTAYYMPPEQAKDAKRADNRSDIYALGATFYHVLTGRVPYDGETSYEVMTKHEAGLLTPPRKVNPDIPERLSLIVEKMMNKTPEYRFKSADEVVAALEQVKAPVPASKTAPTRIQVPRRPSPDKRIVPGELWCVAVPTPGGRPSTREFDLPTLQRHIEEGRLPLDAPVRRGKSEAFKSMDRYPQLARALRICRAKQQEQHGRSLIYGEIYHDYDRRVARQALIRKIKTALRWLFLLAFLGGAAWAAVKYGLPFIRR